MSVEASRQRRTGADLVILSAVVLAGLLPFLDKPVHIDDPLFLWAAQRIADQPLDPFGFDVNWSGQPMPMHQVTQNPPLTSYFLAAAGGVLGWSERALHAAMLLPALGAAWGTYLLAMRWCRRPLLASLVAVLSPVYLVSASTLMCDMLLLCFWVWTVLLWDRGLERRRIAPLFGAACLAAAAFLSKYVALALVPLLAAASAARRGTRREATPLLVPLLVTAAYELAARALYGHGLVAQAAAFSTEQLPSGLGALFGRAVSTLAFAGPLGLVLVPGLPVLVPPRVAAGLAGLLAIAALAAGLLPTGWVTSLSMNAPPDAGLTQQVVLWALLGAGLVALSAWDAVRCRDATSLTLLLWIAGILFFAAFVNWTTNARSLLPLAPAVGILLARRLDHQPVLTRGARILLATGLTLAASVSLAVLWADVRLATSARRAARLAVERHRAPGRQLWVTGHWGFQWYAEAAGARPLNAHNVGMRRGDRCIAPPQQQNTEVARPNDPRVYPTVDRILVEAHPWLATMDAEVGAGFYSSRWGPLPFSVWRVRPHEYTVVERAY